MKNWVVGILGLVSLSAFAAEPPAYYQSVHGTLVASLFERHDFDFTPGSLSNCTRNDAGQLVLYKCDVSGAKMTVAGNGTSMVLTPAHVNVFYKRQQDGRWIHEYDFVGSYSETGGRVPLSSTAELVLWNYEGVNGDIQGSFKLIDYGVFGAVQATDAQR